MVEKGSWTVAVELENGEKVSYSDASYELDGPWLRVSTSTKDKDVVAILPSESVARATATRKKQ